MEFITKYLKDKPRFLHLLLNVLVILFLLYLPYYLFDGRLFLGGDDTRFYYAYPQEVLKSLTLYSWNNISSLPLYSPNFHLIPFLIFMSLLDKIFQSKILLFYLSFSSVFIIGFIYFQKLVKEIIGKEFFISFVVSLIYVFSPITLVSHIAHFLTPVWLVALAPVISYYFLRYIREANKEDLLKAVLFSLLFSFVYFAIPWMVGLIAPVFLGIILFLILSKKNFGNYLRRTFIFIFFIVSSQIFWILSFATSLIYHSGVDLGSKIVSKSLTASFAPTVYSTATGNILYPLLTFYHRQIAFDFMWPLRDVFISFYDKILFLSLIFPLIFILGVIKFRESITSHQQKIFLSLFASVLASLYLFTVNIGFLKYLFILFGYLPGFVIFRNFTDKFSLGFIFTYCLLLAFCLLIIKKSFKFYLFIFFIVISVMVINIIPIKEIINSHLWKADSIYQTVNLPQEYLSFAKEVKNKLSPADNIIAFPQTIGSYAIINEENQKNAYIGTSPLKFLSGVNDLSGTLSYPPEISDTIQKLIEDRNYKELLLFLKQFNIGYVMVTKNINQEELNSYLYNKKHLKYQDSRLISSISDKLIIKSTKGNFLLYKLNNSPAIISSTANVSYNYVSPVEYKIRVRSPKGSEKLFFNSSFNKGWKLYAGDNNYFYLLSKPVFDNTHRPEKIYGNEWTVSSKKSLDLTLYFFPQNYFYLGILLTFVLLSMGIIYLKYEDN